jgi:hypothetical protein
MREVLLLSALVAALLDPRIARADDAERLRRAVEYTLSVQQPSGLFLYDFDFLAAAPSGSDNVVRQAGTLYALGEYLLETGDARVAAALLAGLERMRALSVSTGKGRLQWVLEPSGLYEIDSWRLAGLLDGMGLLHAPDGDALLVAGPQPGYQNASSGATALALSAELGYSRATGDQRFADARAAWLRGLLALRVRGSGVRASPITLSRSPYFEGETWLALAHYREAFPDDAEVERELGSLEDYLFAHYGGEGRHTHFFHWGGMASAVRRRTTNDPRFAEFASGLAAWYLDEVPFEMKRDQTTCSVIEGSASILAALGARPAQDALVTRLRGRVAQELARNRALQIEVDQQRIGLPGGGFLVAPRLAEHAGAILAGPYRPYTRIDLTQHCISGFLKALRIGLADGDLGDLGIARPASPRG